MSNYDTLKSHQAHLIRKMTGGSLFLGELSAPVIPAEPFAYTAQVTGPPLVPHKIDFAAGIVEDYFDAGLLSDDGIGFENEVEESNVTSWQDTQPTRTDIVSDIDTLTVTPQETKLATINLWTGALLTPGSRNASTGTVSFAKAQRPSTREWRGFAVGIDGEGEDEFIIGRIYPRLKVTGRASQAYNKSDDPLTWGVTMQARYDSTVGYSCRYVFGGLGWRNLLADMGFTAL